MESPEVFYANLLSATLDDMEKPTGIGRSDNISIPNNKDEIMQLLSTHKNHKGLLYASKSINNRKSPHTASILLLGQTGVGKSSTVNTLFQNKNLAKISGEKSCTKDLVEYDVKIPMKDYGVTNSRLKIIDTPGFGDTGKNSENLDQMLILTLKEYFLTRPKPSIVLIVARFDDNRYNDYNSGFVKTLRLVESLKESVFEKTFKNYLLVLTHLMKEDPETNSDPKTRCESFANALPNYTNLSKPAVVVAENCAEKWKLPMVNGYAKLPNGSYYPINLFREIEHLLENEDPMAIAIIHSAFKDISQLKIETKLITIQTTNVAKSDNTYYPVLGLDGNSDYMKTEIAQIFAKKILELWPNDNYSERDNILLGTLLTLHRMKIKEKNDLPFNKSRDEILKLMRSLDCHPIILKVFQFLKFDVPQMDFKTEAKMFPGQFFNALNMELMFENDGRQIFKRSGNFIPTLLGYKIPEEFKYSEIEEVTDIFEIYDTNSTCMVARLKKWNVIANGCHIDEVAIPYNEKVGHNVMKSKTFTGLREHRLFKISLQESNLELSAEFSKAVSDLPEFDPENNSNSVIQFENFFSEYGTHVVDSFYGGGSINITLDAKGIKKILSRFSKGTSTNWNDVKSALKKFIDGEEDFGVRLSLKDKQSIFQNCSVSYKGGSEGYWALGDLFLRNAKEKSSLATSWIESLKNDPIILYTDVKLVSLSYYVKLLFEGDIGKAKAKDIQNATKYFLGQKLYGTHRTMSWQNSLILVTSGDVHEISSEPSTRDKTPRKKATRFSCC